MYDGVVRKHPHISFFDGLIRDDHADDKCRLGLIYSTFTALYIYTGGLWKPHKTRKEYRAIFPQDIKKTAKNRFLWPF